MKKFIRPDSLLSDTALLIGVVLWACLSGYLTAESMRRREGLAAALAGILTFCFGIFTTRILADLFLWYHEDDGQDDGL